MFDAIRSRHGQNQKLVRIQLILNIEKTKYLPFVYYKNSLPNMGAIEIDVVVKFRKHNLSNTCELSLI